MKVLLLAVCLLSAVLAQDDSTAGSSDRTQGPNYAGNAEVMTNSEEGTFDMGDVGAGELTGPGAPQSEGPGAPVNATKPDNTKCMCKGVDNGDSGELLSAGWKKRAKKCASEQSGVTSETADGEKCQVLKTPRCEDKEERKKSDQCASKPKTRAQKDAKAKANAAKGAAAEAAADNAAAEGKSKCLSKYCADEDNLNRAKNSLSPPTSQECYDKCHKSHCIALFDAGWEHWYECVQTCIGSCYNIVDG